VEGYKKGLHVENLMDGVMTPLEVLNRLFNSSEINIDGIWGGYTGVGPEAVIPSTARAKIEVRLIPNQKPNEILRVIKLHLQKHGFSDIKVHKLAAVDYCQTDLKEGIAQALIRSYETNEVNFNIWPSSLATIPISLFNHPPLNLPFATGCVGFGGHSHGSDEYAVIKGQGKILGMAGYEKIISSLIYEYNKV
ncbi:MAG: peptidase dimerization domain-containing protein, partial [Candidatus Hodarchaeales archaeon]